MNAFKTLLVSALSALMFLAIPQGAQAQGGRWARLLGLSAAQVQQIRQIRYNARRQAIQLRAKLQLAMLDVRQLLAQHRPDVTALTKALDKAGALKLALKKHKILSSLKVRAVLTPKQFEKWKELRARRQMRRRRMRRWRRMRRMRNHGIR